MTRDALAGIVNRQVTREELLEALHRPINDDERDDVLALVRWFTRRYPTTQERLAYVRRAYRRWAPTSRE